MNIFHKVEEMIYNSALYSYLKGGWSEVGLVCSAMLQVKGQEKNGLKLHQER